MFSTKQLLLIALTILSTLFTNAQNVGIGTSNPPYKLTVQTPKTSNNWGIIHTDSNVVLGSFIYSHTRVGIAEFGTKTNSPFYLFANNTDLPPAIAIEKNGVNVGIGNETPIYSLDVHSAGNAQFNLQEGIGQHTALFSRYTNRLEIQPSDAFQISIGGIDQRNLCIANNGYTGIGTSTPSTRLQVLTADASYGVTHTNGPITVGTFIGSGGGWFGTQSNHPLYFFTNNSNAMMTLSTNGNFGIGTITPTNILQVGTYTNANFGGNQLALGFGTNVTVMNQYASLSNFQTTTALNIQSGKDIYLMPENGSGKVGINTNTPGYALDVNGSVSIDGALDAPALTIGGGSVFTEPSNSSSLTHCSGFCGFDGFSILAGGPIQAEGFFATSDARFKDIKDISNSSNDLETLNAIKITDYTLKDKRMSGDRLYKKVIAQQVEEVYPQIVNRGVNYIPNVYQFTNKIEQTTKGYLLTFTNKHNISKEAKKIQLQDGNKMRQYNIIAVPSENQVIVNGVEIKSDTVFVYGEQVNDFRSVDYDGLTTLNISATQELSKLVKQQQAEIDAQNVKIDELQEAIKKLIAK